MAILYLSLAFPPIVSVTLTQYLSEDFLGPISLSTGSIFDHRLALSFNCYEKVLLLF
jgi:hypothetical protein